MVETGDHHILIDPMLGAQGTLPPFARLRHKAAKNPTVALPDNASQLLGRVTHCLITHCQKFGLRALQHTDHLDGPGAKFLKSNDVPVVCPVQDAAFLRGLDLTVGTTLEYWSSEPFLGGEIVAVPARHGHGWVHNLMANGAGFFLRLPDEPSLYISGDTVYTEDVKRALVELKPDIAVVAAGGASLDVGGLILMSAEEVLEFVREAPGQVVANHLEALNHCPMTRVELAGLLGEAGLSDKVLLPEDGEMLLFGEGGSG